MAEYTIKRIGAEEFSLLIPLMRDCFGMDVDINYFKWKYTENPSGSFVGFIAVDEAGEIGAYYGVIPEAYIVNGMEKIVYQSCDTMTHSAHRRRGLFQKLATHCYQYLRESNKLFVIGFGGGQSTPGFIKFGWKHIFNIQYYFYLRSFLFFDLSFLIKRIKKNTGVELISKDDADKLTLPGKRKPDIFSVRKYECLKWRISNPLHEYRILSFRTGQSQYQGYLVYYLTEKDVFLFDLYTADKKSESILMMELKKVLIREKKRSIITFCQINSDFSNKISRYLFFRNRFKKGPLATVTPFIVYSDDETLKMMERVSWDITAYDHDAL